MTLHSNNLKIIDKFKLKKAFAYFEGKWEKCPYKACNKLKTCKGGPRGTCTRTKGIPLCCVQN